jgi:hypothetical protein
MAEDSALPGWPKKKLVKAVRRHLWSYGIRPNSTKLWAETWAWASQITNSYVFRRWPLPSEIGSQYVLLLLLDMSADRGLKLPHRAFQQMPLFLRQRIESNPVPMLEMKPKEIEEHVAPNAASESAGTDV